MAKQTKMSKQERMVEGAMMATERAQAKLDEEIKRLAALDAETAKIQADLAALAETAKTINAFETKAIGFVHESEEAAVAKAVALVQEKLQPFEEQLAQIEAAKATVEGSIGILKTERDAISVAIHASGDAAVKGIVEAVDAWRAKTSSVSQETERQLLALVTAKKPVDEALVLHKAALGTLKDASNRLASLAAASGLTSTTPVEPVAPEPVSAVVEPEIKSALAVGEAPPRRLLDDLQLLDATRDLPAELLRVTIPPVEPSKPIVSSGETLIGEPTTKSEAT